MDVRLLLESEVLAVPGGTDYTRAENRGRLERAAESYVKLTMSGLLEQLQELGADPVGFGMLYRGRFASWQDWDDWDWRTHVPTAPSM